MSKGMGILFGIVGMFVLAGLVVAASLVGTYNSAIGQEAGIKAQYEQNKNNYANFFSKIKEISQVTDMYAADLQALTAKVVEGRKGSDQELVRFISEKSPMYDSRMYSQLMSAIDAGRNEFEANQKSLIDKTRVYEMSLNSFPSNVTLGFFGFPKIKIADYSIVTNDQTVEAFATKKAAPIKLREAKTTN